jgi:GT2 family glycosyltransferase
MSVCAVLVTYNRSTLLREALAALLRQTRPVDRILVVDNASTDGTRSMLCDEFPQVDVLTLPENVGSAGGFYAGIARAFEQGFEWVWTLDDDAIAEPSALAALLSTRLDFPEDHRPNLLASKVVWTDGQLHPMNVQKPKLYDPELAFLAAECATMSIRFTSFVSMLVHRSLIEQHGLPIHGYFMWNDDVEYSARMLRSQSGVMVPASIVTHKTAEKYVPATSVGGKYYYELRNKIWLMWSSHAFDFAEKKWMAKSLVKRTWRYLMDNHFAPRAMWTIVRGISAGLLTDPPPAPDPAAFAAQIVLPIAHAA